MFSPFPGPTPTFTTKTSTVTPTNKCTRVCRDLKANLMLCAKCKSANFTLRDLGQPSPTPASFTWGIKVSRPFHKVTMTPTSCKPTVTLSKNYERLCKECLQSSMQSKLCLQVCQAWLNAQTTPALPSRPAVFRNQKARPQPTATTKPSEPEAKAPRTKYFIAASDAAGDSRFIATMAYIDKDMSSNPR